MRPFRPATSHRRPLGLLVVSALAATVLPVIALGEPAGAVASVLSFSTLAPIDSGNDIGGVSCPTVTLCVATDLAGNVLVSTNPNGGAATWHSYQMTTNNHGKLNSVTCASESLCIGVDDLGPLVTTNPTAGVAATWRQFTLPGALGRFSCPSVSFCFGVGGGGGVAFSTNPTSPSATWTTGTIGTAALTSISCPTVNFCAATDDAENVLTSSNPTSGPGAWTTTQAEAPSATNGQLTGISCPTPALCVAVDHFGNVVTSINPGPGATWTKVQLGQPAFLAVSCPVRTLFCAAVDASGRVSTSTDPSGGLAAWSLTSLGSNQLNDISCTGLVLCVAVDDHGNGAVGTTANFAPPTRGYWLVGSDGGIFSFGAASFHGSTGSLVLQRPVVGISPTSGNLGYWLVASDGGLFAFGNATYRGSIPALGLAPAGSAAPKRLNAPVVGMVPTADGGGYFMIASDGGVFAFGDAVYEGSCPGIGGCAGAAVAVVPDASGGGYWLVTKTGNVYAFGDAQYKGAPGSVFVPVTGAARTPDGGGYWILFANGVVASYGDAANLGGPIGEVTGSDPASAIFANSGGEGFWVADALGAVYSSGDAPFDGSMAGTHLNGAIIAGAGF